MNEIAVIQRKIYEIRGQKVILDRDLAALYQVETLIMRPEEWLEEVEKLRRKL